MQTLAVISTYTVLELTTPLNSRSNVNNRPPVRLTAEEAIDLFQALKNEKTILMWNLKVINLNLDVYL